MSWLSSFIHRRNASESARKREEHRRRADEERKRREANKRPFDGGEPVRLGRDLEGHERNGKDREASGAGAEVSPEEREKKEASASRYARFLQLRREIPDLGSEIRNFRRQEGGVELKENLDVLEDRAKAFGAKFDRAYGDMRVIETEALDAEFSALRRAFDDLRSSERGADAIKDSLKKL